MKTILVPLSYHEEGQGILQYALDFAHELSANITILKSYNIPTVTGPTPPIDKVMKENCHQELRELIASIDTKKVKINIDLCNGNLVESCSDFLQLYEVDLIISKPKLGKKDAALYIGHRMGNMIKNLECPILLVPDTAVFKPFESVLMAIKSGIIKRKDVLDPLETILNSFKARLNVLQVITPKLKTKDFTINEKLTNMHSDFLQTENDTVFHGLLEKIETNKPDLLCVIRRNKGFFSQLWDQYTVKKSDFDSTTPLLILKGAFLTQTLGFFKANFCKNFGISGLVHG